MDWSTLLYLFCLALVPRCTLCSHQFIDCGGENASVHFYDIAASPEPFVLGQTIRASGIIDFVKPVTDGLATFEVTRIFDVLGYQVPIAFPCPFNPLYDVCTFKLCDDMKKEIWCSFISASNHTCGCQESPSTMKVLDYEMKLPSLPLIASYAVAGRYRITYRMWQLPSPDTPVQIGCFMVIASFAV